MNKIIYGMLVSMVLITSAQAAVIAPVTAPAAPSALRIGVVDIQKVVQQSPETQTINKSLEQKFKPRQEKIASAEKDVQAAMEKLNRDSAVMSQADRDKLAEKISIDRRELARMQQDFQEDVNNAQRQAMQSLFGKIQASIDVLAKQNHYDLILQKYGVPFASNTVDITDQVVKSIKDSKG